VERIVCNDCAGQLVCQCPPCLRWWYHLYGITSSRTGFIENYVGPHPARRNWNYSTPRVSQAVDFALRLPLDDIVCTESRSLRNVQINVPAPTAWPHRVFVGPAAVPAPTVFAPRSSAWSHAEGIQPEFNALGPLHGQEDRDFDRYPHAADMAVPVVYPAPGLGGPSINSVQVHPVTGRIRLDYSGVAAGRSVHVRYWHVSGLSPSAPEADFRPYGGGWITPPRSGFYEFQLAAVLDGFDPLVSNSIQSWYRVEEVFHRPFAESRARVPPLLVAPPTTTPLPVVPGVQRPARPVISVLSQDYTEDAPAIRVVVPSSPAGALEYRYWRHTGHLVPEDLTVWHRTSSRSFVIRDLPALVVPSECFRDGAPAVVPCPLRVPVFWDVQVRVTSGAVSDLSPARSVLLHSVGP